MIDWFVIGLIAGGVVVTIATLGRLFPGEPSIAEKLARWPRAKLAEVAEGSCMRVIGRASQLEELIEAPITGRRCLYYQVHVLATFGRNDTRRILLEERGVPFILEDGPAHAVIDPSGASVFLEEDGRSNVDWHTSRGYRERALLGQHQAKVPTSAVHDFVEGILEVGDTIAVVGTAVREIEPDATPTGPYRGEQPTRLRITGSRKQPMIISDHSSTTR